MQNPNYKTFKHNNQLFIIRQNDPVEEEGGMRASHSNLASGSLLAFDRPTMPPAEVVQIDLTTNSSP